MKNGFKYVSDNGLISENTGILKLYYDFGSAWNYEELGGGKYITSFITGGSDPIYYNESGSHSANPYSPSQYVPISLIPTSVATEIGKFYEFSVNVTNNVGSPGHPGIEILYSGIPVRTLTTVGSYSYSFYGNGGMPLSFRFWSTPYTNGTKYWGDLLLREYYETDMYSGQICVYTHRMEDKDLVPYSDYSDIIKDTYINLIGNRYTSESGLATVIRIENSENLYSGNDFTFFIEGGKLPRNEALEIYDYSGFQQQLPLHNKEVIFSNMEGSGLNCDGFEFGINSANLMYFRTIFTDGDRILTFDKETPRGENIWGIRYISGTIDILRYNHESNAVLSSSMLLGGILKNGGAWTLNSGENQRLTSLNTGTASDITSSIKLRKFAYFSEALSNEQFRYLSEYANSEVNNSSFITDSGYIFSVIAGETGYTEVTGWYQTGELIGYVTGSGNVEILISHPLYGTVQQYGEILEDCGNGLYSKETTLEETYSITGLSGEFVQSGFVDFYPVYSQSTISYITYSGYTTGVDITSGYFENSGYTTGVEFNGYDNLLARSVSYMGERFGDDFTELVMPLISYSGYTRLVNCETTKQPSTYSTGFVPVIDRGENMNSYTVYLNGLALLTGDGYIDRTGEYDNQIVRLNGDYLITGNGEIITQYLFTGEDQISNLHGIYDMPSDLICSRKMIFYVTGAGTGIVNGEWISSGEAYSYPIWTNGIAKLGWSVDRWFFYTGTLTSVNIFYAADATGNPWDVSFTSWYGHAPAPYPVCNAVRDEQEITDISQYESQDTFDGFYPSGRSIFLNGVKLYENVNYYVEDGNFSPIGYITGITGKYIALPIIDGDKVLSTGERYPLEVCNAGTESVNGNYTIDGTGYEGRLVYVNGEIYLSGTRAVGGGGFENRWVFYRVGQVESLYWKSSEAFEPYGLTGWQIFSGAAPEPSLSNGRAIVTSAVYDIYKENGIRDQSVLFWINGVRKSPNEYIYHDGYVDMITGYDINKNNRDGIFNGNLEI